MQIKFVQKLDLVSYEWRDRENTECDVAMYHSKENACEMQDEVCTTHSGLYFGTTNPTEPKFCSAHFFSGGMYQFDVIKK